MENIQKHELIKYPIYDGFYKIFIVLSKDCITEIEKKIANFSKKDIIAYIQAEFEKSWKGFVTRLSIQKK